MKQTAQRSIIFLYIYILSFLISYSKLEYIYIMNVFVVLIYVILSESDTNWFRSRLLLVF